MTHCTSCLGQDWTSRRFSLNARTQSGLSNLRAEIAGTLKILQQMEWQQVEDGEYFLMVCRLLKIFFLAEEHFLTPESDKMMDYFKLHIGEF